MDKTAETEQAIRPMCGLVMPISSIDGCSESHWSDVLEILSEAANAAGFDSALVSNADDSGLIHKRIIQNLYDNPMVVCDVSAKNPNVMFELGIRLAFDKPTIVIKDDKTSYSFDTSGIEHLEYPRDLRFSRIIDFKKKLAEKLTATHDRSLKDTDYSTFLKNFGTFTVAKLDSKEISSQEYLLDEVRQMRLQLFRLESSSISNAAGTGREIGNRRKQTYDMTGWTTDEMSEIGKAVLLAHPDTDIHMDHSKATIDFITMSDSQYKSVADTMRRITVKIAARKSGKNKIDI